MPIQQQMQTELLRITELLEDAYEETNAYEARNGPDHMMRHAMTNALRKFFANCDAAGRVVATNFLINRLLIDVWQQPPRVAIK
jgi:hypothetical protein